MLLICICAKDLFIMRKTQIAIFISSLFFTSIAYAEHSKPDNQLDTIFVIANGAVTPSGSISFSEQDIARIPLRNGNISELLKNNPAVQFSGTTNNSIQAGEIAPDLISFHGEPYYNNSYLIDGLSNNDLLNPGSSNGDYKSAEDFTQPTSMYIAPGSPESFYVNSRLLRNVTVYDSNVPAKYGRFTGGVVDAEIKDPELSKASGSISYRTTRDAWTSFQLNDEERAKFDNAYAESDVQPKFTKHIFDFTLNQPINEKAGILFSYNRTQSKMPEYHQGLNRWEKERRIAETFLLKGSSQVNGQHKLLATLLYSPHKNVYYNDNVKNGRYVGEGGGWRANIESQYAGDWGAVKTTLAYQYNRNKIAHDAGYRYYNWLGEGLLANSGTQWCSYINTKTGKCDYKREGGIGELSSELNTWTVKQDYELDRLNWGITEHKLFFGWQMDFASAKSERPYAVRYMSTPRTDVRRIIVGQGQACTDCIPNEQFQNSMTYYPAFSTKVNLNNYNLYFSDEIYWQQVKFIPGVNVNYDNFQKNLNIAPRFSFNINVLNDDNFNITGGYNRYFANNMLAYALRSTIPCHRGSHKRLTANGEWILGDCAKNFISWNNSRNLKTPYSDEYNLGFNYTLADHRLAFNWVHRKSERQFVPAKQDPKNKTPKTMTNGGKGQTNTFILSFQNNKAYHFNKLSMNYRLGLRYQHRNVNYHGNYDESLVFDPAAFNNRYYLFEGKRYASVNELPPFNFNQPWEGFIELQTDFPDWNLKWTHVVNYKTGYKAYHRYDVAQCANSSQPQACGDYAGAVYDYRLKKYSGKAALDWHLLWSLPVREQKIEVNLDVLNVFNSRVATSSLSSQYLGGTESQNPTSYQLGRQFWLGIGYYW